VYKLRKAMYGLKNAPKAYSDHFMSVLSNLGFKQSTKDECLWSLKNGKSYIHYLFHVDDILVVSNNNMMRDSCFIALEKLLKIRDEGPVSMFLGMLIKRLDDGSYSLSQKHYIEKMANTFNVDDSTKSVDSPLISGHLLTRDMCPKTEAEKAEAAKLPFPALMGSLIYATKTRPEISYSVSDAARFMSNWGVEHFRAAMRILKYLYSTRHQTLTITPTSSSLSLSVYCDANHGDSRDGGFDADGEMIDSKWKSQGGYLVFLNDSLVSWRSRRHKCRCLSSMESEYVEACEAAKEVRWFRELLGDLGFSQNEPTIIYEDNQACIAFSKNNTNHDRTKHIDIKAYWLRDAVRDGLVVLKHVDTKHQLADMMTKTQLKKTFVEHVDMIYNGCSHPTRVSTIKSCVSMCGCLSCFVGSVSVL
jgi:hypothetical protein